MPHVHSPLQGSQLHRVPRCWGAANATVPLALSKVLLMFWFSTDSKKCKLGFPTAAVHAFLEMRMQLWVSLFPLPWETCCHLGLGVRNWPGYTETGIKLYMRNKQTTSSPVENIEVPLLFRDDKMDKGEKQVSVSQPGQQRIPKAGQCLHCFNTSSASPLKGPNDKDTEGFFLFAVCFPSNKYTSCTVRIPSFSLFFFFSKIETCQGCIQRFQ